MTEADKAAILKSISAWQRAAPELDKQRRADIRASDTAGDIQRMTLLFRHAIRSCPPRTSSGLIEQQRWFMKLRRT